MSKRILYLGLDPSHYQEKVEGEVVHWPIIEIRPRPLSDPDLQNALTRFDDYTHLLMTSKTTVFILMSDLAHFNIASEKWRTKTTLAIGKVTAKILEIHGITPFLIAQEETAEGLIDELKRLDLTNAHVFWPHSSQARSVLKEFLIASHICHTTCALYDPHPHLPNTPLMIETFDEIVFTSPSTVRAFLHHFGHFPAQAKLTAIGPITARYLYTPSSVSLQ